MHYIYIGNYAYVKVEHFRFQIELKTRLSNFLQHENNGRQQLFSGFSALYSL